MTDRNYNKTDDQITAIMALICSALHDEKPAGNNRGRFEISKNGILAIVDTMKTRKGKQIFLLTGFDIQEKLKEVTDAIKTVNAQYSSAPEYSGFRKQVVAVTSSII
jgi:Ni,Fe-hydrogenase III component G